MKVPRVITKWLPSRDLPFLKAEEERLTEKGWTVEIQSKRKTGLYDKSPIHALIVLKVKQRPTGRR